MTRSIKVSSVGEKYQTTPGADCILPVTDLVGGQYFLEPHQFSGLPIRGAGGTPVAAFVAQQYKLEVAQQPPFPAFHTRFIDSSWNGEASPRGGWTRSHHARARSRSTSRREGTS